MSTAENLSLNPAASKPAVRRKGGADAFRAKLAAMKLFEQHLAAVGDGTFRYVTGWSDQKVAEESGLVVHRIRHLRHTMFGPLAMSRDANGRPNAIRTIPYAALVTRVVDLADRVEALSAEVVRLKAALGD